MKSDHELINRYNMLLSNQPYLNILVRLILNEHFMQINCINFMSEDDLISLHISKPMVVYNLKNETFDIFDGMYQFGCHGFVIYTSRPKYVFELIEYKIRFMPTTKFHERRYLFVPLHGEEYSEDLFESNKLEYVADLILIQPISDDGAYEFWSHKFVGFANHTEPLLLDKWFESNQSFLDGADLYPNKIRDQHGRALRINTFDYKPYINIDSEHGMELMMATEYAKFHNMSIQIIRETEFWGVFFDNNYTATGAKGTLWNDKSDISVGSWYRLPNYTRYFDLTESTVRIGVTFLVPAPELAAGWFTPLFSFATNLWLGFIVSYFGLIISQFSFEYFYHKMQDFAKHTVWHIFVKSVALVTVTLFIQQPLEIFLIAKAAHLRRVFVALLIAGLFFAAVYGAGFSSVMTVPRYTRSIENSEELDASGIKWGAIHPALLDGFRELPKYSNVVKNIIILTDKEIKRRMHLKNFAMLADRVPNGLVLADRVDANDLVYYQVLQDDLYTEHCVLLVKRSSILIPSIRRSFMAMKEGGLVYFWEMLAFFEENFNAQQALKYKTKESGVVELHWQHVQGAFGVLWIGMAISAVCLAVEIFLKRKELKKHGKLL